MHRRQLLKLLGYTSAGLAVTASAGVWWLSGPRPPVVRFADFASVRRWLDTLSAAAAHSTSSWPLPDVLEHCAQSIEFSLHGFPKPKPAWFQGTAGALAFSVFDRRGAMQHGLTEPIPGAGALAAHDIGDAMQRLRSALDAFERYSGELSPHFAYGRLDKAQYARAHLMHLANHAETIAVS